tara:strand:+ start:497 stop:778 length:282 start_codon:yes stop_codon:yes gene_type:complete
LKVQQFLQRKTIESPEDISLQLELFAYMVAKHYGVSLMEVYQMSEEIFTKSLVWAMAVEEEQEKAAKRQEFVENTDSSEIVNLDYSFLEEEDF